MDAPGIISRHCTVRAGSEGSQQSHQPLTADPRVQCLNQDERAQRESFAAYIGDQLKNLAGCWDGEEHKSAGFHRRVALLMPEALTHEALSATRDAIERARAGHGCRAPDPGAYFAGAVRKIAARERVDLGVAWT